MMTELLNKLIVTICTTAKSNWSNMVRSWVRLYYTVCIYRIIIELTIKTKNCSIDTLYIRLSMCQLKNSQNLFKIYRQSFTGFHKLHQISRCNNIRTILPYTNKYCPIDTNHRFYIGHQWHSIRLARDKANNKCDHHVDNNKGPSEGFPGSGGLSGGAISLAMSGKPYSLHGSGWVVVFLTVVDGVHAKRPWTTNSPNDPNSSNLNILR